MSKNVAMFVDVANMYYAARGQDVDVDYVALLKHATKGRDLIRAYAYTGLDPENENQRKFIDFLGKNGYKPVVKDIRKFGDGRMKANLDIELVVDLFRLADRMDIAVIVSGDGDFAPAIRALQDKGVRCEVVSFKPNTSSDLIAVADEFMDIMKVASISRKEGRAAREVMSAPEMPAKEVSPEFGFREASPSVAAAALAALKTSPANGRRTRSGTAGRAAAPAEEPAGERIAAATDAPTEPGAESEEQARRRRRRRGGRGRGRTRRDGDSSAATTPSEPAPAGADAEPAWQEFDDISQIDLGEEREYTFEEADAATLAELGLSPEDVTSTDVPAEAPQAEADAEPRRRGRRPTAARARGKADEPASDEDEPPSQPEAEEAPKPRARSPRRRGTAGAKEAGASREPDASDDDSQTGTPKRARRATRSSATPSRSAKASGEGGSAGSGTGDAEPQGIWGRFRGARKPRGTA